LFSSPFVYLNYFLGLLLDTSTSQLDHPLTPFYLKKQIGEKQKTFRQNSAKGQKSAQKKAWMIYSLSFGTIQRKKQKSF